MVYRIMRNDEQVPLRTYNKKNAKTFYIHGMWLFGAKWDQENNTICDLSPDDLTGNEIPTLELTVEEYKPFENINIKGDKVDGSNGSRHHRLEGGSSDSFITDSDINSKDYESKA